MYYLTCNFCKIAYFQQIKQGGNLVRQNVGVSLAVRRLKVSKMVPHLNLLPLVGHKRSLENVVLPVKKCMCPTKIFGLFNSPTKKIKEYMVFIVKWTPSNNFLI